MRRSNVRSAAEIGDPILTASGLGLFAGLAARRSQADRTARLAGAAQALYARHGRKPWEDLSLDTLLPGWSAGPDQALIAAAYADGQALAVEAAVALALAAPSP